MPKGHKTGAAATYEGHGFDCACRIFFWLDPATTACRPCRFTSRCGSVCHCRRLLRMPQHSRSRCRLRHMTTADHGRRRPEPAAHICRPVQASGAAHVHSRQRIMCSAITLPLLQRGLVTRHPFVTDNQHAMQLLTMPALGWYARGSCLPLWGRPTQAVPTMVRCCARKPSDPAAPQDGAVAAGSS